MDFDNYPTPVASTVREWSRMDEVLEVKDASSFMESWMVDLILNVDGVDEQSSSRVILTQDGRFSHGSLRAGIVLLSSVPEDEIERVWREIVTDAGIDFTDDNAEIQMRLNPSGVSQSGDTVVPHLVFGNGDGVNPLSVDDLTETIRRIVPAWNEAVADYSLAGRSVALGRNRGSETTTGTVEDMLDNL